jgi:N-carbamoylputrescine amidase
MIAHRSAASGASVISAEGPGDAGARTDTVQLTICQTTGEPYEPEQARARTLAVAEAAFASGAQIVLLPELVVPGYGTVPDRMQPLAEPLDGPTVRGWTELARRHHGYVAGGLCERSGEDVFNTAVIVGPAGIVLHYRKLHLFAREAQVFTPGDLGLPVVDTPFGRLGVCICYDLRFVETVRILALRGAEIVLVPTAWVPGFDAGMWDEQGVALQAQSAIVQANLSGIELDAVVRAQQRDPLIRPREDRRSDVYGLVIPGERL